MMMFVLGVFIGIVVTCLLQGILWRRCSQSRRLRNDIRWEKDETLKSTVYNDIFSAFLRSGHVGDMETCEWLNALLKHIIVNYVGVDNVEELTIITLNNMIEEVKIRHPRLVGSLEVKEFYFGKSLPVFNDVVMERGTNASDVNIVASIFYDGGIKLVIETEIVGISVGLSITTSMFSGKLRIQMRRNAQISLTFIDDPDISFEIQFRAGGIVSPRIANFISRKLKAIIKENIVLPNWQHVQCDKSANEGKLRVTVVGASDLSANDSLGKFDPYCVCVINDVEQRTTVLTKTSEPVWNESLIFHVPRRRNALYISMYGQDAFLGDVFLGQVIINISNLPENEAHCQSYKLCENDDHLEISGSVTLELLYNSFSDINDAKIYRQSDEDVTLTCTQCGILFKEDDSLSQDENCRFHCHNIDGGTNGCLRQRHVGPTCDSAFLPTTSIVESHSSFTENNIYKLDSAADTVTNVKYPKPVYNKKPPVFNNKHCRIWLKHYLRQRTILERIKKGTIKLATDTVDISRDVGDFVLAPIDTFKNQLNNISHDESSSNDDFDDVSRFISKGMLLASARSKKMLLDIQNINLEQYILDIRVIRRSISFESNNISILLKKYCSDVDYERNILSRELSSIRDRLEQLRNEEIVLLGVMQEHWTTDTIEAKIGFEV